MSPEISPHSRGEFRRMAEGIYQYESSGAYYARFRHRGERIFERLGTTKHPCTSLPEAKRLLRELKNQLERTDVAARKKTLHQVIEEYRKVMDFSEGTMGYKELYLDRLRDHFPSNKKVEDIKNGEILTYIAGFKELSASTVNHIITTAREVFNYAVQNEVIARSPMDGIKYKKVKDKKKKLIPSWEEFQAIVKNVRSQKYADTASESGDLIEFMGLAGLGQGECADLTWGDINFKTAIIAIIRKKTGTGFSIPIYPQLRPLIKRMEKQRSDKKASARVFGVSNPKKSLEAACKRLNLPDYTARAFRRMFITQALEKGVDPQTIAEWQGHRDGGHLILKTYGRVRPKHQKAMAALMAHPSSSKK